MYEYGGNDDIISFQILCEKWTSLHGVMLIFIIIKTQQVPNAEQGCGALWWWQQLKRLLSYLGHRTRHRAVRGSLSTLFICNQIDWISGWQGSTPVPMMHCTELRGCQGLMEWMLVIDVFEEVYMDWKRMMLAFSTQFKSNLILFFRGLTLSFSTKLISCFVKLSKHGGIGPEAAICLSVPVGLCLVLMCIKTRQVRQTQRT